MKKIILFTFLLYFLIPTNVCALSLPNKSQGYVSDFANVLSINEKQQLEQKLSNFEQRTTDEVAIVTTSNLEGTTIEEYSVKLFEKWGIGKKGKDNGLLIVVAPTEHQARIEVGYGLEPVVTDAESSWIIRTIMIPAFKNNQYYQGLDNATNRIEAVILKEATPQPISSIAPASHIPNFGIGTIFFIFFSMQVIYNLFASSRSWWLGGVIGGIAAIIIGIIYGFFITGIIALAILIPLGLLIDYFASKRGMTLGPSRTPGPWWWGTNNSSGWGSGSNSGGFGGFGGGRSGGGGSNGSW